MQLGLRAASVLVGIGGVQLGSSQLGPVVGVQLGASQLGHYHLSSAAVVQLGLWAASVLVGLDFVQLGSSQPGLGVVQLGSSLLGHSHLSWAAFSVQLGLNLWCTWLMVYNHVLTGTYCTWPQLGV